MLCALSKFFIARAVLYTPRHKLIRNPIPTILSCFITLFVCLFVVSALNKKKYLYIDIKYIVVLKETKM